MYIREVCVGSFAEARKAERIGADRIELCDNLGKGGTTPSYGTIVVAKKVLQIPIMVIIRPRGGDFVYSKEEIEIMKEDIRVCKNADVKGVVVGILDEKNSIDKEVMKELIELARPMEVTFHMAFDEIEDKERALEELIELGVDRVLTKGCKSNAVDGRETIRQLVKQSRERIIILPGGGVREDNYLELLKYTGAEEAHGTRVCG